MLLPLDDLRLKYGLRITGILHVGAHVGQEAEVYTRSGVVDVTWVEANPEVIPRLRAHVEPLGHRVVLALVADRSGDEVDFHVTNNEMSSSILRMGMHQQHYPDVVVTGSIRCTTTTLDDLCAQRGIAGFNMLTLDVQGAELLVLRGAQRVLAGVDYLQVEVNEIHLYEEGALLLDVDSLLEEFDRVEMGMRPSGWGDAFYVRTSVLARSPRRPAFRWHIRRARTTLRTTLRPRTRLRRLFRRA